MKIILLYLSLLFKLPGVLTGSSVDLRVYLDDKFEGGGYELLSRTLSHESLNLVEINEDSSTVEVGKIPVAVAKFQDTLLETGWGILDVETRGAHHDGIQAYSAGFAEGYATAHQIVSMAVNVASVFFKDLNKKLDPYGRTFRGSASDFSIDEMPQILKDFLQEQEDWTMKIVQQGISDESHEDFDFYFQLGLVMEQFDGMIAGYEYKNKQLVKEGKKPFPKLPRWVFQMLNAAGDLNDLIPALIKSDVVQKDYDYFKMPKEEAILKMSLRSSCSALIKVLPGNEDLLMGHSSWFSFSFTNRIYKHYLFEFNNKATAARGISFSSYPGFLESLDDFYTLDSGISWTQTSNPVLNKTVYHENNNIKSSSLLAWQRVRVASSMMKSGKEFLNIMKKHFSGTYANQYIIVDYNLFTPGEPLRDNTLWIVEEMPGLLTGNDMTDVLRYGYWPSYNVPAIEEISKRSGFGYMATKFDSGYELTKEFSHSLAPRAEIFRRDHGNVQSIEDLKKILRFNDFRNDKYSNNDPALSLCSRYDLPEEVNGVKKKRMPYGCYDTKVTSFKYGALQRRAEIISGPPSKFSLAASYIEPFSWKQFEKTAHVGLPETYKFKFIKTKPYYTEEQHVTQKAFVEQVSLSLRVEDE